MPDNYTAVFIAPAVKLLLGEYHSSLKYFLNFPQGAWNWLGDGTTRLILFVQLSSPSREITGRHDTVTISYSELVIAARGSLR
jgi:hypothetical protein